MLVRCKFLDLIFHGKKPHLNLRALATGAGSPGDINVLRAGSPGDVNVPRAGSPGR